MRDHADRLARIRALLDEVERQQQEGREIAAKMEELRREVDRALAQVRRRD